MHLKVGVGTSVSIIIMVLAFYTNSVKHVSSITKKDVASGIVCLRLLSQAGSGPFQQINSPNFSDVVEVFDWPNILAEGHPP